MESLTAQLETAFDSKPANEIRNVCLIAHVDHGKTTFADSLVTTNSIISTRLAGKLRYMDSRPDEQERGITMKASGVSLLYGPLLVNLIDSPGHVDFSSEVSSALLLSDIALLLVDVVEGVCSQTHSLMRQAIQNGQSVILVLNKIDRLKIDLKMEPAEAYQHIVRLLEAVNSSLSQFVSYLALEEDTWDDLEALEQKVHFDPQRGNVLFASAIYGYAFGVDEFADIWAPKLKLDKVELAKHLFGDFWIGGGKIQADAAHRGKKTLFEQLVLEPLWSLHDCALIQGDLDKMITLAGKLGLTVKTKRLPDAFSELMRTWLPLPSACFRACARGTSALNAFKDPHRIDALSAPAHPLHNAIRDCQASGPTIAFAAKFIRQENQSYTILRVLSGKISKGDELFVSTRKMRATGDEALQTTIEEVYFLRGREMVRTKTAVAGTICAVRASNLVQNVTLSSIAVEEGLRIGFEMGEPLVRVSVTSKELEQINELKEALRTLVLLDPSLRVLEQENGELAMITAGEMHLQKCLKDLEDMGFIGLEVSEPIVPFQETVIPDPTLTATEIASQVAECRLRDEALYLQIRVAPLSTELLAMLERSVETLRKIRKGASDEAVLLTFKNKLISTACETLPTMRGTWWHKKSQEEITSLFERIWCFGPEKARSNIMFNNIPGYENRTLWNRDEFLRPLDNSICTGWELFCGAGPLANEPMRGVAVIIEEWRIDESDSAAVGQLVTAVKQSCKASAQKNSLRLVAAMYKCVVTTTSSALGKVHMVLSQRRAKTLSEDINEATGLFEVNAVLPVVESFDFCEQLRTKTSGMASGQLEFSHWQTVEEDPYWVPTTQDEIEEFGVKGDSINHAKLYMDTIRRRKGLPTDDLIVVSAEKQRNLKKNK